MLFSFLRQSVHSLSQAVIQRLRQWTQPDNHTLVLNAGVDLTRPTVLAGAAEALPQVRPQVSPHQPLPDAVLGVPRLTNRSPTWQEPGGGFFLFRGETRRAPCLLRFGQSACRLLRLLHGRRAAPWAEPGGAGRGDRYHRSASCSRHHLPPTLPRQARILPVHSGDSRWARRRHPHKSWDWRYRRYWRKQKGRVSFSDGQSTLVRHEDTPIQRHVKVRGDKSPRACPELAEGTGIGPTGYSVWAATQPNRFG